MPVESTLPRFDVPQVDIWTFLFDRKDREYPGDKGWSLSLAILKI
jgi:4-coumarate--CoA ligase